MLCKVTSGAQSWTPYRHLEAPCAKFEKVCGLCGCHRCLRKAIVGLLLGFFLSSSVNRWHLDHLQKLHVGCERKRQRLILWLSVN